MEPTLSGLAMWPNPLAANEARLSESTRRSSTQLIVKFHFFSVHKLLRILVDSKSSPGRAMAAREPDQVKKRAGWLKPPGSFALKGPRRAHLVCNAFESGSTCGALARPRGADSGRPQV